MFNFGTRHLDLFFKYSPCRFFKESSVEEREQAEKFIEYQVVWKSAILLLSLNIYPFFFVNF